MGQSKLNNTGRRCSKHPGPGSTQQGYLSWRTRNSVAHGTGPSKRRRRRATGARRDHRPRPPGHGAGGGQGGAAGQHHHQGERQLHAPEDGGQRPGRSRLSARDGEGRAGLAAGAAGSPPLLAHDLDGVLRIAARRRRLVGDQIFGRGGLSAPPRPARQALLQLSGRQPVRASVRGRTGLQTRQNAQGGRRAAGRGRRA